MEQILYNQSLKAPTISVFQGIAFLKVLIFSIFQQLLYNPILQVFHTKVPVAGLDSSAFFKSDWSEPSSYISLNQDSLNATKYTFIVLFTLFRMASYIIYKLSDQDCRLCDSLDFRRFRWSEKRNTNRKRSLSFGKVYLTKSDILPISTGNGLGNRFIGLASNRSLKCFQKMERLNNNNTERYSVPKTKAINALLWREQQTC
ncbi:hypothetical protein SEUBUCD646_0B01740 [Saccharomyces eubayanus]|uniref:Uncharacterized protein n=1 Tax=Saccharomyces eubayanus TaxID=1080349 RepID=A0ABN8VLT0_SACEU|nr:hypothetical protein DI49_0238 [Saccharomyces eubayanus]KOH00897.1 hypothetical protein DI49_0238 [Saccharomyces eubayanus]CAI1817018.1 hypothetical protein SEUBUCD650_0B01750 [Saccharomyces eubayanus]CAI1852355.1 hypothetical protein SEUBUCD646_0B01740 [Saccharomyces eubayanus]